VNQTTDEAAKAFRHAVMTATIGELCFPTSMDAGRRVLKAIENPDLGLPALATIIVAEPLLSAKLVRLANSAALNPANTTVRDLGQAVMRVGMDLTRALAMVLIMDQLRQSQHHGGGRDLANRLWERSIHVAALSYVLSKKLTSLNADEVMFSAIVHDLGRFYLLSLAADYPALLEGRVVLAQTINDLAGHASAIVLHKLKLPASVIDAVLASPHCSGTMPPETAQEVLFIAGFVSPRRDPFDELDSRIDHEVDRAQALGLDQGLVAELIAQSADEIDSLVIALAS
jgi:HD-like signal output (HDOD) protein